MIYGSLVLGSSVELGCRSFKFLQNFLLRRTTFVQNYVTHNDLHIKPVSQVVKILAKIFHRGRNLIHNEALQSILKYRVDTGVITYSVGIEEATTFDL